MANAIAAGQIFGTLSMTVLLKGLLGATITGLVLVVIVATVAHITDRIVNPKG